MEIPKYETGPDPKNPKNPHGVITILDGDLSGVSVRVGCIKIEENGNSAILSYDVELVEDKNNREPTVDELREPVGQIITELLLQHLDTIIEKNEDAV